MFKLRTPDFKLEWILILKSEISKNPKVDIIKQNEILRSAFEKFVKLNSDFAAVLMKTFRGKFIDLKSEIEAENYTDETEQAEENTNSFET